MLSDKWLAIYGLLGNFEGEVPHFGDVLQFLPLALPTGVGCHGFITNLAGNIWSKYECFLISGCQGMDFREALTQKTHILKMY